ncbi:DUF6907 domain-containing protein [Actinacidiphila glaucinigra]|uniref:DUF6907 domain-containing protein n=1 Tax=Actinacidiphila glaucinigra TaxID=235986 RepID=UPI002E308C4F|nr:hypothetical protein [Actinacidiphila glaucinigra]
MTGRRIVRLETVDAGEITFECPLWCTVPHTPGVNTYSDEIVHYDAGVYVGPEATRESSMAVARAWQPFGDPEQTTPYLSVDITLTVYVGTAEKLEQAAATLEAFAAEMRALAPKLTELQEEER